MKLPKWLAWIVGHRRQIEAAAGDAAKVIEDGAADPQMRELAAAIAKVAPAF